MLPDKWRCDTSQDWEVLEDNFDSVNSKTIPDATLQALAFYHSPLKYFEEKAPRFVDVTDKLELAIEPKVDNQPITDFKNEKVRKGLKRAAKRKARRNNLCVLLRQAFITGSVAFLLLGPALSSCSPMFASLSCHKLLNLSLSCFPVPALLSCPGLPIPLLFRLFVPALLSYSSVPTLLSLFVPALLSLPVPALVSCFVLGPNPTWLTSSTLITFKQALSNESLGRQSISPSLLEPLCPFPVLGPLLKKSDCKRLFDTTFINSRPLATNHAAKEVELSFEKCGCLVQVKLNRL